MLFLWLIKMFFLSVLPLILIVPLVGGFMGSRFRVFEEEDDLQEVVAEE